MTVVTGLQIGPITVLYTNYRGETAVRVFKPLNLYWGSSEWHPEPQWLMDGWDEEKQQSRTFALKDMRPVPDEVKK